jgi:hypothetical protein
MEFSEGTVRMTTEVFAEVVPLGNTADLQFLSMLLRRIPCYERARLVQDLAIELHGPDGETGLLALWTGYIVVRMPSDDYRNHRQFHVRTPGFEPIADIRLYRNGTLDVTTLQ